MSKKHLSKFIVGAVEYGIFDVLATFAIVFYIYFYYVDNLSAVIPMILTLLAVFGGAVAKTALFIWQTVRFFASKGAVYPTMLPTYVGLFSAAATLIFTFMTFKFSQWIVLTFAAVFFVAEVIMTLINAVRHKDTFIESGSIYTGNN